MIANIATEFKGDRNNLNLEMLVGDGTGIVVLPVK
jgi:hypothetical protein